MTTATDNRTLLEVLHDQKARDLRKRVEECDVVLNALETHRHAEALTENARLNRFAWYKSLGDPTYSGPNKRSLAATYRNLERSESKDFDECQRVWYLLPRDIREEVETAADDSPDYNDFIEPLRAIRQRVREELDQVLAENPPSADLVS